MVKSKATRIDKLLIGYAVKVEDLWDKIQLLHKGVIAIENKLSDIQNDYDMLYDNIKTILKEKDDS